MTNERYEEIIASREYIPLKEAIVMLGRSRSMVYKMMNDGLTSYHIGRKVYLKKTDIEEILRLESTPVESTKSICAYCGKYGYHKFSCGRPNNGRVVVGLDIV